MAVTFIALPPGNIESWFVLIYPFERCGFCGVALICLMFVSKFLVFCVQMGVDFHSRLLRRVQPNYLWDFILFREEGLRSGPHLDGQYSDRER